MERVWIALGDDDASETVVSRSGTRPGPPLPPVSMGPATGLRATSRPSGSAFTGPGRAARGPSIRRRTASGSRLAAHVLGSIWGFAPRPRRTPDGTETRLLSSAADQIGQALAQDRLAAESQAAEIARQSDALKSALLQSVSHDLRTPLATIRAAAGTLRTGQRPADADRARERGRHRSRGRVPEPAGDQPARPEPDRGRRPARRTRRLRARRPRGRRSSGSARASATGRSRSTLAAPPVEVDPVFLDEALTNVAGQRARSTRRPGAQIRISAARARRGPSSG